MPLLTDILTRFFLLIGESAPGFLLGTLLAAGLQRWIRPETTERWIGTGSRSVVRSALAGALLPGCAVSTIPLALAMKGRGTPVGTLTAFIMIAPILSPHTVALTALMLGPEMTVGRIVLPFLLSVPLGILLNRWHGAKAPARPAPLAAPAGCCDEDDCCGSASSSAGFWPSWGTTLRTLLPFLLAGLGVVAVLQALLPSGWMEQRLEGGFSGYAIAAGAGLPLYVCEGAEVPLTRSLLELGAGLGPAFTFLLASVGTCFPTIAMSPRIIGWGPTLAYVASWLALAIGGGILLGAL